MAFFQNQDDELDGNGQPVQTSAQSGTLGGGQQTQAPTANPSQNTPDKPGNFVGIKTYLDANKKQAGKLGNQIGGVIGNSANQARQGVQGLNDEFNQKAGSAVGIDQDALKSTEGLGAINDQQKQTLQNQLGAQYGGPADLQSLGGYQDVNKNVGIAAGNLKNSGTEEGRKSLIGQVNNKARTAGMTNFDNALVQSGVGRENIANAVNANKDAMNLDQTLAANNTSAQQKAADISAQDEATRNATSGAVNTNFKKIYDALGIKQQNAVSGQDKDTQTLKDLLAANDPTKIDSSKLGLNVGDSIYNLNLADYAGNVQAGDNDITRADVASDEEASKLNALNELVNQSNFNLGKKEGGLGPQFTAGKDLQDRLGQYKKDLEDELHSNRPNAAAAAQSGSNAVKMLRDELGFDPQAYNRMASGQGTGDDFIKAAQAFRDVWQRMPALAGQQSLPQVQAILNMADKYKQQTGRRIGVTGDNTMGVS